MNTSLPKYLMAAALIASCAVANADNKTNAPVVRPLSVFNANDAQGKDPFFPESTRRLTQPAIASAPKENTPAQNYSFSLKGISGSKLQPLALINNATVGVGEFAEVRASGRPVKIRCREIRDQSVVIEIDGTGEVKELKLRDGI